MPIKERFLSYVELQRAANATREAYGPDDQRTIQAYVKANVMKRRVMNEIEELEFRMQRLEK
jgi:hypothetical protein